MKKIIVFSVVLIFASLNLSGQKAQDTLYLKNGSVVYGKLTTGSNLFRIKTSEGYNFSFTLQEVERFVSRVPREMVYKSKQGPGFSMESGIHLGSDEISFPIQFSINPMLVYTFDKRHSLGIGTGLELFGALKLPLFLEYKINLSENNVSPFLFSRIGSLIALQADEKSLYYSSEFKNGWTFAIGFGLKWPLGKIESYVKLGYRYAYTSNVITDTYSVYRIYEHNDNFNCFEMNWGFKF